MSETLDTFLQAPLDELFGIITEDEAVRSFGWDATSSRIFKGYDGRVLPILADGRLNATDLPALYVEELTPSEVEDELTPETVLIELAFELRCVFPNQESHKGHTALRAMSAMLALLGAIKRRDVLERRHEFIDELEAELAELNPVREGDSSPRVLYWDGGLNIRLRRVWSVPN